MNQYQQIVETLKQNKSYLWDSISEVDGNAYLCLYTEDSDAKEQWTNYIDVVDELKRFGMELQDSYTEHDCISGDIILSPLNSVIC